MKEEDYETDTATNVEAIARIAQDAIKPALIELPDGVKVLAVPEGMTIESVIGHIDPYLERPRRLKGVAKLEDLASFIAHAKRFADQDSALFANPSPTAPSLTSVLNYHRAPLANSENQRHGDHRGVYAFPLSEEWSAWTAAAARSQASMLSQADFAELIDKRLIDVADPTKAGELATRLAEVSGVKYAQPSKLLDCARGISLQVKTRVANAQTLATGETQITYQVDHETAAGMPASTSVPSAFLISIPVFRGGALYAIPVRVRYRLRDHEVKWALELHRADVMFAHAFEEACATAAKETGLPLFVGSPEAP